MDCDTIAQRWKIPGTHRMGVQGSEEYPPPPMPTLLLAILYLYNASVLSWPNSTLRRTWASSPPKLFDLVRRLSHFAARLLVQCNPPFDRQENVAHLLYATSPRVQAPSSSFLHNTSKQQGH